MSNFNVLTLGEFINEEGIEIAVGSFAELFHNVTSKHQKVMRIKMVTKGTLTEFIMKTAKKYQIEEVIDLVHWSNQENVEALYEEASLMILPTNDNVAKLTTEALSYGIPVLCFENEDLEEVVDQTCGFQIKEENLGENIQNFSELLRILYFDPEARKILKKGATCKYEEALSWGFSKSRKNTSRSAA